MLDRAIVHDVRDPSKRGRIRVTIPAKSGASVTGWIWPAASGAYLVLPKPGDQVWVSYESGDKDFPVWLGHTKIPAKALVTDFNPLLKRVETLETKVTTLQSKVASLESRVQALEN